MPAILNPNVLVDSLVPDVIDGLRSELHPLFGVRPYHVSTVQRTWSGKMAGEGTVTEVVTQLEPQPRVEEWRAGGLAFDLERCGLDTKGEIVLREVSLQYTEAELLGPRPMANNMRWGYRISDAHGQGARTMTFVVSRPPFLDREKDMGWVIFLRASEL